MVSVNVALASSLPLLDSTEIQSPLSIPNLVPSFGLRDTSSSEDLDNKYSDLVVIVPPCQ